MDVNMVEFCGASWGDTLPATTITMTNTAGETVSYELSPWDGLCCSCRERPGSVEVHGCPGGITHWCRLCLVEDQLKSAREAAARIPALEAELASLNGGVP